MTTFSGQNKVVRRKALFGPPKGLLPFLANATQCFFQGKIYKSDDDMASLSYKIVENTPHKATSLTMFWAITCKLDHVHLY